jgi:polysaccharide deacetylase 2 family uncharacterized protein YibQ
MINRFRELQAEFVRAQSNEIGDELVIEIAVAGQSVLTIQLVEDLRLERNAGQIALVFDLLGRQLDELEMACLTLPHVVNFAILPGFDHSRRIAEIAVENGHGVLTRLEMNASNSAAVPEAFRLAGDMRLELISRRVRSALSAVPKSDGICMLTDATPGGERAIANILEIIRKNNMLYMEANLEITPALSLARRKKIKFAHNTLTMSDIREAPLVQHKLTEIAEQALREGRAVGLIYADRVIVASLADELSRLRKRGCQFVKLTSIVK